MKKNYERPTIDMVEVKIEKGFATSKADTFGIQNFDYADGTTDGTGDVNSAW